MKPLKAHSVPAARLRAIPGYQNKLPELHRYMALSWLAACTILWNGKRFTEAEQHKAMQLIRSFLLDAPDLDTGYTELVQRLVIGRQQLPSDYGSVRTRPSHWFSPGHPLGFESTKPAYDRLIAKRRQHPLFRIGLRSLADAFLDMYYCPSAANYHYWRSWFQQRNSNFLLNILLAFVANRCKRLA